MDISVHPQSLADRKGRLFESNGHIFRGIPLSYSSFYSDVLTASNINRLFSLGLVSTERSNVTIPEYPLVLKHQRVDFITYWPEWPSLMLRDAALMVCDLNIELIRQSCGILDCHPWNVLFDFGRPVFVDFPAVIPLDESWLDEMAGRFRNYYILPLTFIAMGHPWFARSIRRAPDVLEPVDDFLKRRELRWFPWWYFRLRRLARKQPLIFFERLRKSLQELRLPTPRRKQLGCRELITQVNHEDFEQYGVKANTVLTLLERLKPKTVLDIGCGDGWYSLLAERMGAKVVSLDWDEGCLNQLYQLTKSQQLRILPLLMDFMVPTPSHGRKCEFPSATERLHCETSLMLRLVHHLVFDWDLSFERIAQLLCQYSDRHAIVEFIPLEDSFVATRINARYIWYGIDNFVKAMERHFKLDSVLDSEAPRKILLFSKR
jgi:SAM-dependent methyltransferase